MSTEVVIVSAARTPMGGLLGSLSAESAPDLGAVAIAAAVQRAGVDVSDIDEVYFGTVISAGQGQAPARQASLGAGLPQSVPCTTVSKVCGSGMQSVMMAADYIRAGNGSTVVAGGMENMSQAPYLLDKARGGYRLGHGAIKDSMYVDGLEDAGSGGLMGSFGQATADKFGITREQMDEYALESLRLACQAIEKGWMAPEIAPVTVATRQGEVTVSVDEQPGNAKPEKIPQLKPAFAKNGTVTAANSSSISDGAAALVLMSAEAARAKGLKPLARIVSYASHARAPAEFTLAPIGAIEKTLKKAGWTVADVDLFEINEAFAVVALLAMQELGIPRDKVNVHGGACALGHPLGASGARIMVTLLNALNRTGKKRGLASLCIGGGEATAIAVELL